MMKKHFQSDNKVNALKYDHLFLNHPVKEEYFGKYVDFEGGEQLYIRAYICNDNESGYYDSKIGNIVYSTVDVNECSDALNYKVP